MSNPQGIETNLRSAIRRQLARAIADGILRYNDWSSDEAEPATAIGIFDRASASDVVARSSRLRAKTSFTLGDTARVPYGTKSPGTVIRFACEEHAVPHSTECQAVVVAAITVSAWALPTLERKFSVPIFGVIIPGAQAALQGRYRRIGVIGTVLRSAARPTARILGARPVRPGVCPRLPIAGPLV